MNLNEDKKLISHTKVRVPNTYKVNQFYVARHCESRGVIW